MSPVSPAAHLAPASSVHVPPMPRTSSVHVAPAGPHVTPHGPAPRRPAQDGHVAAVEVPASGEAPPDVQGREEVAGGAGEAAVGAWSCKNTGQ